MRDDPNDLVFPALLVSGDGSSIVIRGCLGRAGLGGCDLGAYIDFIISDETLDGMCFSLLAVGRGGP